MELKLAPLRSHGRWLADLTRVAKEPNLQLDSTTIAAKLSEVRYLKEKYDLFKNITSFLLFFFVLVQYHKQSSEYIKSVMSTSNNTSKIDPIDQKNIDPKLNNLGSESLNLCGCSLAWFRTSACHVENPGSNPGNRTTSSLTKEMHLFIVRRVMRGYGDGTNLSWISRNCLWVKVQA